MPAHNTATIPIRNRPIECVCQHLDAEGNVLKTDISARIYPHGSTYQLLSRGVVREVTILLSDGTSIKYSKG